MQGTRTSSDHLMSGANSGCLITDHKCSMMTARGAECSAPLLTHTPDQSLIGHSLAAVMCAPQILAPAVLTW